MIFGGLDQKMSKSVNTWWEFDDVNDNIVFLHDTICIWNISNVLGANVSTNNRANWSTKCLACRTIMHSGYLEICLHVEEGQIAGCPYLGMIVECCVSILSVLSLMNRNEVLFSPLWRLNFGYRRRRVFPRKNCWILYILSCLIYVSNLIEWDESLERSSLVRMGELLSACFTLICSCVSQPWLWF